MTRIDFEPIQSGSGIPSLTNVRLLVPPVILDGIGEVYGGYLNVHLKKLVKTWRINAYIDGNYTLQWYSNNLTAFGAGMNISLPENYSSLSELALCNKIPILELYQTNPANFPYAYIYIPVLYNNIAVIMFYWLKEDYPEMTDFSSNSIFSFASNFFTENPIHVIARNAKTTIYNLTNEQLASAMQQLNARFTTSLEERRNFIINSSHYTETSTGSVATFNTNLSLPLKNAKIYFLPVQEGSGDPSPTNVRLIHGWTGLDINRCGKNLFDKNTTPFNYGYIDYQSGAKGNDNYLMCTEVYIPCNYLAGKTITLNHRPGGSRPGIAFYDVNKTYLYGVANGGAQEGTPMTVTVPQNAWFYRFTITEPYQNDIQIELGSTATPYEPYNGTTTPISWQTELYGGYIDFAKGLLVITYKKLHFVKNYILSISDNQYGGTASKIAISATIGNIDYDLRSKSLCDKIKIKHIETNSEFNIYEGGISPDRRLVFGIPSTLTDLASVQNWMDLIGGFDLCYPVAPVITQLTPQILKTLVGSNNVWSNTNGDVEIQYWKH